tara:strand:+ start:679 stop:1254 length:576 start_codon:yes stop_codon:yes gene_type:complete
MTNKKKNLYFVIDYPKEVNLDYVRNTGANLILRKPENSSINELIKFQKNCSSRGIELYIGNNIKILFRLKTNKLYLSAYNKKNYNHLKTINSKIQIIGGAHNMREIKEKIRQGCRTIILSRLFKTRYKNKKGFLGTIKFNLLARKFKKEFIALGGINNKNFDQIKLLNVSGVAMSSDKKKAGNYLPAFYKN